MGIWKKIISWTVCITLSILGFIVGIIKRDWHLFTIKYEIDVVTFTLGILTLALTIFIAHYVSNVLEKSRDLNKNERELTLSKIRDLIQSVDALLSLVAAGTISNVVVNSSIKHEIMLNNSILDLVTKCSTIDTETSYQIQIHNNLRDLKNLMTSYPASPAIAAGEIEPVQYINNAYTYTSNRVTEIEQKLNAVKEVITSYSLFVIQS